jgi:uncharacterized membrane protein YqjE
MDDNAPSPPLSAPTSAADSSQSDRLRDLQDNLSSFIAARTELLAIESQEASAYASQKLLQAILLALFAFFAWALTLASITGLLTPIANQCLEGRFDSLPGWAVILLILAMLHGLGALVFLKKIKQKPCTPLFELSRKEIELDKQWLKKNK